MRRKAACRRVEFGSDVATRADAERVINPLQDSILPIKQPRVCGARNPACNVPILGYAVPSHDCERGTQKCVRHRAGRQREMFKLKAFGNVARKTARSERT